MSRARGCGSRACRFAPAAFAVASLVIFWVPWGTLVKTIPIIAISLVLFVVNYVRKHESVAELRGGVWLVVYLVVMFVLALLGPYGGLGLLPEPWGSIVVAVVAVAIYFWGVQAAVRYLRHRPRRVDELREEAERDRELATA